MKRAVWIGVLAVLAFTAILLVRLPASWLSSALPEDVACAEISGTVWDGACDGFVLRRVAIGNLQWQLHPSALLKGALASRVDIKGAAGSASAEVEAHGKDLVIARDLHANVALNPALFPQVPPTVRGRVQATLSRLAVSQGHIAALEGKIEGFDLEERGRENLRLGDYVLTFPAANVAQRDGELVGDVRSVSGPFDFEGTLRLTQEPGWKLEGLVATGPGVPPEVARQLAYLGPADSRGRRPLSMEGTF